MAELALAYCSSHTPLMEFARELAPEQQRNNFFEALGDISEAASAQSIDAAIVISNEHFTNFFLDNFPQLCIGVADEHYGPVEAWLGIPQGMIPGHRQLAQHVLGSLAADGYPISFSEKLGLDHGVVDVYYELDKSLSIPLIPIIQNCAVSPMLPPRRCFELGQSLASAIRNFAPDMRIAVVGAGGLSHDIGTPRIGLIDSEFDRWFLDHLEAGDLDDVLDLDEAEIREAGNGAPEVLSWLVVAGAAWPSVGRTLAYEPVQEWLTGMAVMDFELDTAAQGAEA